MDIFTSFLTLTVSLGRENEQKEKPWCLHKVWSKRIKTEFIFQTNQTAQGHGWDIHVLTCYCMPRHVCNWFQCFNHLWSAFKIRVFLSYIDLTMSRNTQQCVDIKFCEKIRKTMTETYQINQTAFWYATISWVWAIECPSKVTRNLDPSTSRQIKTMELTCMI